MPQLSNLVLTDRQATPVAHTFLPRDITGGVGVVIESDGTPVGDKRVSVSLGKSTNGRYRPEVRFTFPVVQNQTIDGITTPTVVRTAYADLKFSFDPSSTEEERNDLVGMLADALASDKTLINDTIVKLQGVY